tara:strand:+ start:4066 stop:4689 length:624 start_codon:yes stop_codon:yes gene_type:complete
MALNVKIVPTEPPQPQAVKVNISGPPVKVNVLKPIISQFKLEAREALNGDIMVFDHPNIDIIILKEKKKVICFAKDIMNEAVYGASNRLMTFLRKKGVISYDSIQGGNVYGSLEGLILESQTLNIISVTMHNIGEWIEKERPQFESIEDYDEMMDDYFTEPDDDDSTALGKVPQAAKKGSIRTPSIFSPYYYGAYLYENEEKKLEDK